MPFDLKTVIVRVLAADGITTSGIGFILSEKGIIATCSHVIQAEKLQVRGYPKPVKVEVIFRANGERGVARLLPLPLGTSEGSAGHDFQTFGFLTPRLLPY